jgi:hypothetical protein
MGGAPSSSVFLLLELGPRTCPSLCGISSMLSNSLRRSLLTPITYCGRLHFCTTYIFVRCHEYSSGHLEPSNTNHEVMSSLGRNKELRIHNLKSYHFQTPRSILILAGSIRSNLSDSIQGTATGRVKPERRSNSCCQLACPHICWNSNEVNHVSNNCPYKCNIGRLIVHPL